MTSVFERLYLPSYFSLKYLREFTKMFTSNCRALGSYYFVHDIKVLFCYLKKLYQMKSKLYKNALQ